jgi:hypothetical protein
MVAVVAKEFGLLPSLVARDLDEDPEHYSLLCLEALRYSEAKKAFETAKDEESLKPWKGTFVMSQVNRNAFDLHKERVARRLAAQNK